ncbi:MAG: AAA family ATPase [Chloroflexi bacterium]|nr:AAA family ATPase [Chloroflexota bacterium]
MVHLQRLRVERPSDDWPDGYPFNVPVIRALEPLAFTSEVTFFVGENGSGKSALLEAIACAVNAITAGSESVKTDPTLAPARALARHFRLSWTKRTNRGLFLRAEDFFGYVKHMAQTRAELEQDLAGLDEAYKGRSAEALGWARVPYMRELGEMKRRYGRGLDAYSHGESFIEFAQARFVPNGLYLLDEPEAALSPKRQLAFLALMMQAISRGGQFIVATHSPILMAYPGAVIFSFDDAHLHPVAYDELEHVWLTRSFLNKPEQWLNHLIEESDQTDTEA